MRDDHTPSNRSGFTTDRRTLLKGMAVGVAGIGAAPLLAACTGASKSKAASSTSKSATLGSSGSDALPKNAIAAMVSAFKAASGDTVTTNTKAHNDFQNQINTY